jgi:hypothetical protein
VNERRHDTVRRVGQQVVTPIYVESAVYLLWCVDPDLLDHSWRKGQGGLEVMAAARAEVDAMVEGPAVDGLGWKGGPLVLGMAGLSADAAFVLALWRWRLGGLDDVRGGGLGGGRGIVASRGELLAQLGDDLLEGGEFRLEGIDSRLEPNTIGAGSRVRDTHGDRSYTLDRSKTTPVNGHLCSWWLSGVRPRQFPKKRQGSRQLFDPADPLKICET